MSDMELFTFLVYLGSVVLCIQIFICFVMHKIEHILIWQEDQRRKEEKDERKRKYNVKWNDQVFVFSKGLPACFPMIQTSLIVSTEYHC